MAKMCEKMKNIVMLFMYFLKVNKGNKLLQIRDSK